MVRIDIFGFLADFIIMNFSDDEDTPIMQERPFIAPGRTLINVEEGELTTGVDGLQVVFNVLNALKYP